MIDISTTTLHINDMVEILSNTYISVINQNVSFKKIPSVMLWGAPGVGKSQGVRQIAEKIHLDTNKNVNVVDVRLLLFNPVDLRGIPTSNADKTLAVWLKPQIFQMDESNDVVNILFLDEISAAPPSVQAAAYQITLDRVIGEHKLPENCIVIAAGNRVTDKSVAYTMPKALANRLCHLEICSDNKSWHKWALNAGIHESIIGFLTHKPSMLMQEESSDEEYAFATPRSWEMVSNLLKYVSDDLEIIFPMIVGCIGEKVGNEFKEWYEVFKNVPPVNKIFKGTHTAVPHIPSIIFALSAQIVAYARKNHSKQGIDNAITYVSRFPIEFRNKVYYDLLQIKEIRSSLKENNLFCEWFDRTGRKWEYYSID